MHAGDDETWEGDGVEERRECQGVEGSEIKPGDTAQGEGRQQSEREGEGWRGTARREGSEAK
ncbi:hypothetical protein E2C01_087995 [Portunus trituberculatus]|uniref:Uncharacterized protein n=1 Tax=Portunus trituberculatus TaxID=210409 RepID=A0A5B7J9K8_PORTR|nr:hypothetical protein [Portunus trituberculatus]